MTTLVLTVIGADRAGLVKALADVVTEHGGNWERSHLAQLAGKFAGMVEVSVPASRSEELQAALRPLHGMLEVEVQSGTGDDLAAQHDVVVELVGNDHPGIVQAISGVLAEHGLNVAELETTTREAPMAGGRLFEARAVVAMPQEADVSELRAALEELASEVMVDVSVEDLTEA